MLLEALTALGYVEKRKERFENSAMTRHWLLASGAADLSELFFQFDDMLKRWDYLDETVRKGTPPSLGWEWLDAHAGSWAVASAFVGMGNRERSPRCGGPTARGDLGGDAALAERRAAHN